MIKTGILGSSETANIYAGILKNAAKFELTGCYSPNYAKSKQFASDHELVAYPTAEALFNYAEALIITDFAPDFLVTTEKAIKNFKHILITNPFLAGLEEIQYLRKLSEESGVIMQIAGGFKFKSLLNETHHHNYFLADLKHTFNSNTDICNSASFMEFLLNDISLLLILLKGMPKKISTNSWNTNDKNTDLLSARIELDNGCVANVLFSQLEESNKFCLNLYGNPGVSRCECLNPEDQRQSMLNESIQSEINHFEKSIRNRYLTSLHNDMMFQALEIAHNIKSKATRNITVNLP